MTKPVYRSTGFCMYDFVVKFTFVVSSPDEFLLAIVTNFPVFKLGLILEKKSCVNLQVQCVHL